MERLALSELSRWWKSKPGMRKPLILRGARQVGKSFLVRDFCARQGIQCLELNFEREPSLRKLFLEGHNSKTVSLLATHFGRALDPGTVLFLDEIQAAPEIFARLRYFFEDTPGIAVVAAGSLLEFALAEAYYSVPVGRVEYLYLGPLVFEEYLGALGESALLNLLREWNPDLPETWIPEVFHQKLGSYVRDFSLVGGMPEAINAFLPSRDFLRTAQVQRSLLDTYKNDFAKYRRRTPIERLDRVFGAIPSQIGKKWVHARVSQHERAAAVQSTLDLLCMAKVAHCVFHTSGNGVPLAAEKKDQIFKLVFLDVGLAGNQLGLRAVDVLDLQTFARVNEGALAEQWIGQHLLEIRAFSENPELFYWVREKAGSMAEVDYLFTCGPRVIPVEVKSGPTSRAKSLQVFLDEKKNPKFGVLFSPRVARWLPQLRVLELPFYLVGQLSRICSYLDSR